MSDDSSDTTTNNRPVWPTSPISSTVCLTRNYPSPTDELAAFVLHVVGSAMFTFGCVYDFTYVKVPPEVDPVMAAWSGRFKFLTNWDAILQAVYYTSCTVADAFGWNAFQVRQDSIVARVNDYAFTALCFPVATFVSAMFWTLYWVDRNLVMKAEVDKYFPFWLNHIMHTMVSVWSVAELLLVRHVYEKMWKIVVGMLTFHAAYIVWMLIVHYKTGLWVYNIFEELSFLMRILFLSMSVVATFAFFGVGLAIHLLRWGHAEFLF